VRESVIRPVLCLERKTIEAYLAENGLRCCQDSTNEEDAYTRNRIRHHILPYAEREICAGAAAHMGELAEILADTERYLEAQTRRLYGAYVQEEQPETDGTVQCLWIDSAGLLAEDPVMRKRVLLACMERLTPYRKDITGKHIAGLEQLMTKDGSREIHLPCRLRACKEYDRLCISNVGERALRQRQTGQEQAYGEYTAQIREKQAAGENTAQIKDKQTDGEKAVQTGEKQTAGQMASQAGAVYQIVPPAQIRVPGEGTFVFTLLEKGVGFFEKEQNIPQNRYTKWFDYDKITTSLLLRTRRQGDYMTIDEAMHTKTVKQYMINEKIPKMQRDSMHLLADGSHVLWIPGYRISQKYKVEESTERILEVRLEGGSNGGTNRSVVE
ncbi:MAG: tRNA lysidine(34) synthetase TilS, partial [Lachnospiraceae bacterium]|nr:tRNA lysidine(34) synthetase TilS [Lachnospiraceae bacterium]